MTEQEWSEVFGNMVAHYQAQLADRNNVISILSDRVIDLEALVEEVEWVEGSDGVEICPWCKGKYYPTGHKDDCGRQRTVKGEIWTKIVVT